MVQATTCSMCRTEPRFTIETALLTHMKGGCGAYHSSLILRVLYSSLYELWECASTCGLPISRQETEI